MFGLFGKQSSLPDNWERIESIDALEAIHKTSFESPVVLFKHSTTCSISAMAKSRLETAANEQSPKIYYLDLLAHRDISNAIADKYKVRHESPQVIVVNKGEAVYNASHGGVNMNDIINHTK